MAGKMDTDAPIACSLDGAAMKERLQWIRDLGNAALLRHRRDGLALDLAFDPRFAAQVEQFVRQEQACCGFLDFALLPGEGEIAVRITVPRSAADIADEVLAYFSPAADRER
ncbi:MAG: hypothetical protein O3A96_17155 [Proteobacteria bacterium]|nr:hypothetical protein [Pseudomonadota bacterium]